MKNVTEFSSLSQSEFARRVGRSRQRICEAVKAGKIFTEADGKISTDHPLNKRYMEASRLRDLRGFSSEMYKPFPTLRARQIAQLVDTIVSGMADVEKNLAELRSIAAVPIGTKEATSEHQ